MLQSFSVTVIIWINVPLFYLLPWQHPLFLPWCWTLLLVLEHRCYTTHRDCSETEQQPRHCQVPTAWQNRINDSNDKALYMCRGTCPKNFCQLMLQCSARHKLIQFQLLACTNVQYIKMEFFWFLKMSSSVRRIFLSRNRSLCPVSLSSNQSILESCVTCDMVVPNMRSTNEE